MMAKDYSKYEVPDEAPSASKKDYSKYEVADITPNQPQALPSAKERVGDTLGTIGAGLVGVGRGATAGLVKYPAAAAKILADKAQGYDTSWKEALKSTEDAYSQTQAEHPYATAAGEVVGSMAPMMGVSKVAGLAGKAAEGGMAFNKARVAAGAAAESATNIAGGAVYGGVNAASNNQDVATGATLGALGAGAGEVLGAAAKGVKTLVGKATERKVAAQVAANEAAQNDTALFLSSNGIDPSNLTKLDLQRVGDAIKSKSYDWRKALTPKENQMLNLGVSPGTTYNQVAKGSTVEKAALFKQSQAGEPEVFQQMTDKTLRDAGDVFNPQVTAKHAGNVIKSAAMAYAGEKGLEAMGVDPVYAASIASAGGMYGAKTALAGLARQATIPAIYSATAARPALGGLSALQVGQAAAPMTAAQMFADQRERIRQTYSK